MLFYLKIGLNQHFRRMKHLLGQTKPIGVIVISEIHFFGSIAGTAAKNLVKKQVDIIFPADLWRKLLLLLLVFVESLFQLATTFAG